VAELSAAALCYLIGKDGDKYLGNAYRYIAKYASKEHISPLTGCLLVIADVEKVLHTILMSKVKKYGQEIF